MKIFLKSVVATGLFIAMSSFSLQALSSSDIVDCYLDSFCRDGNRKQAVFAQKPRIEMVDLFSAEMKQILNALTVYTKRSKRAAALMRGLLNRLVQNEALAPEEKKLMLHHYKRFFNQRILNGLFRQLSSYGLGLPMVEMSHSLFRYQQMFAQQIVHCMQTLVLYEQDCSICLEPLQLKKELIILPCAHGFHTACVGPRATRIFLCEAYKCPQLGLEHRHCPNCRAHYSNGIRSITL